MNEKSNVLSGTILLALLGGATLGAMAVTLVSPKKAKGLLEGIKTLAGRFRAKVTHSNQEDDEEVIAAFI